MHFAARQGALPVLELLTTRGASLQATTKVRARQANSCASI
jgi:hypothetical protein